MSRMSNDELKAILGAERAEAMSAINAGDLSSEREQAMAYYKGDMSRDFPALAGRSQAVSSDVADTVEGLMPSLMEIFAATDEVVEFDPVGEEDEEAAQQEGDYVNHVFMQKNAGFIILYTFIKDGLLSKNGIVKVCWDEYEDEERETYYNLTDDEFALLNADEDVEIVEHTPHMEGEDYADEMAANRDGAA